MTPESITATAAGILLVFNGWTLWRQKVADAARVTADAANAKRNDENTEKIDAVKTEVAVVAKKQDETIAVMNGPLGVALKAAADALEILADIKGDNESIMKAHAARQLSDEHIKAREDATKMAQGRISAEQKIIDDFKRRKDPKPVPVATQSVAVPTESVDAADLKKHTAIPVTITTTIK